MRGGGGKGGEEGGKPLADLCSQTPCFLLCLSKLPLPRPSTYWASHCSRIQTGVILRSRVIIVSTTAHFPLPHTDINKSPKTTHRQQEAKRARTRSRQSRCIAPNQENMFLTPTHEGTSGENPKVTTHWVVICDSQCRSATLFFLKFQKQKCIFT